MRKKCEWNKDHGKAVHIVRYTTGERKRINKALCQVCADSVLSNGYAEAKVVTGV